jgi:hypothetical protein
VQINPDTYDGFFKGCFMTVTEPKAFGAQGFICMPQKRGEIPGQAYARVKWEDMEFIGHAEWRPAPDPDVEYKVAE